jgi:hypothetical protein
MYIDIYIYIYTSNTYINTYRSLPPNPWISQISVKKLGPDEPDPDIPLEPVLEPVVKKVFIYIIFVIFIVFVVYIYAHM